MQKNWPRHLRKRRLFYRWSLLSAKDWCKDLQVPKKNTVAHISLGQDATDFQAEVATILDCVTSCLRKKLAKEQITICTDNQAAIAALAANGAKSLPVADYIEKVTTLSEENQITVMRAPEPSSID